MYPTPLDLLSLMFLFLMTLQEYYIRHMDGCTLDTEGEKQRVIKCLEAAIERRVSEVSFNNFVCVLFLMFLMITVIEKHKLSNLLQQGVRLELCTSDRVGLLSDITRIFRENGLSVTRADVTTRADKAVNVFYVTDTSGNPVDMKIVEAMRREIGHTILQVKSIPSSPRPCPTDTGDKAKFSFGSLLKSQLERLSYNFGLIKS
jgi:UTP:GlnB (protein PII) uridylyltransferase